MFKKIFSLSIVIALAISAFGAVGSAQASARTANWVVSVTYQNVGLAATPVTVNFYPEGSTTPIPFDPLSGGTIAPGAGRSFYIGWVSGITSPFTGNAVMSASQPLVATVVQFSNDVGFKMRLLSNGFQGTDVSENYLVTTTLANTFSRTTVFSVQNTAAATVAATLKFYDSADGSLDSTIVHSIPANSSKLIEMDNMTDTGLPSTVFNGSAIISVPAGSGIVAAASELYTTTNVGTNFEGIPLGRAGTTMYLATALCNQFDLRTYFAVQNTSLTTSTSITVYYKNTDGSDKTSDGPYNLGPGQKRSIDTCAPNSGMSMAGFTGSARVVSTGLSGNPAQPLSVIGKAQCATNPCVTASTLDFLTAFLGEPAGASKLAAPFIRYANDTNYNSVSNVGGKQRAFLAIQNLETTSKKVNVKYYDKDGNLIATHTLTIAGLSKGSSNPFIAGATGAAGMVAGEFGYYIDGSFGGSVIIEAHTDNPTAKFIAIVRVQHPGAGEDYNAVPVP